MRHGSYNIKFVILFIIWRTAVAVIDILDVRSLWLKFSERFVEWILSPSSGDPALAGLGCFFGVGGGVTNSNSVCKYYFVVYLNVFGSSKQIGMNFFFWTKSGTELTADVTAGCSYPYPCRRSIRALSLFFLSAGHTSLCCF